MDGYEELWCLGTVGGPPRGNVGESTLFAEAFLLVFFKLKLVVMLPLYCLHVLLVGVSLKYSIGLELVRCVDACTDDKQKHTRHSVSENDDNPQVVKYNSREHHPIANYMQSTTNLGFIGYLSSIRCTGLVHRVGRYRYRNILIRMLGTGFIKTEPDHFPGRGHRFRQYFWHWFAFVAIGNL